MTTHHDDVRRCTVYRRRGESQVSFEAVGRSHSARQPTIADRVLLGDIMSRELICAKPDLEIATVVRLIVQHRVGCIPVVDDRRRPIGVITKFDIVDQLDATMQSVGGGSPLPSELSARQAEEVMMPIALVLDVHATVAHAAAIMALEDTHHVMVIREGGELAGIVSSKDIVKWLVTNDALTSGESAVDVTR